MKTPLYPTIRKRVNDAIDSLIKTQVTPWIFMTAGPPFRIRKFDGSEIIYEGIGFEGSPNKVFWSRYIEPFLENICITEIDFAVSTAKNRDVDGRLLLRELHELLASGCRRVYARMTDVDQRLRGKGSPKSVPARSVEREADLMNEFIEERINGELAMWKPQQSESNSRNHSEQVDRRAITTHQENLTQELERYTHIFDGILSRFIQTAEGFDIANGDDILCHDMILQIKDLFEDELDDGPSRSLDIIAAYNYSIDNMFASPSLNGVKRIRGIVAAALARVRRNPKALRSATTEVGTSQLAAPDALITLVDRFHVVVRQLQRRQQQRQAFSVNDEYDVQDLLHALLQIFFDDIRPEEWTPGYAGNASRMDFLLFDEETVVETKMARRNLLDREITDQILIDIARYQEHPKCKRLLCLIYDPESLLRNPRSIEKDLTKIHGTLPVQAMIVPR